MIQKTINELYKIINERLLSLKPFIIKAFSKPIKDIKLYLDTLFNKLAYDTHKNLLKEYQLKYNTLNTEYVTNVINKYNFKKRIDTHLSKLFKTVKSIFRKVNTEFKLNINKIDEVFKKVLKQSSNDLNKRFKVFYRRIKFIKNQESHRIKEKIKSKTAEIINKKVRVMLMWVSKHDSHVRKEHKILDGQLRTINGYFNYHGHKTKYPGGFGIAKLDLRCRCKTKIIRW